MSLCRIPIGASAGRSEASPSPASANTTIRCPCGAHRDTGSRMIQCGVSDFDASEQQSPAGRQAISRPPYLAVDWCLIHPYSPTFQTFLGWPMLLAVPLHLLCKEVRACLSIGKKMLTPLVSAVCRQPSRLLCNQKLWLQSSWTWSAAFTLLTRSTSSEAFFHLLTASVNWLVHEVQLPDVRQLLPSPAMCPVLGCSG